MADNYKNRQSVYQARYVSNLQTPGYNVNTSGFLQPAVGYQGQPALQQSSQGFYQPYPSNRYQGRGSVVKVEAPSPQHHNQDVLSTQVCVFLKLFHLTYFEE